MRLSLEQISAIRAGTAELAGAAARVWLFGSSVRDDACGGHEFVPTLVAAARRWVAEARRLLRA